ncbi:hypothetical protein [Anaerosporobacter faecicola]|uniref:hypothetical protein n=1 Tax=Anaerosporobacter faecicola TaxID=2718714 RepID=UPI0014395159|nr:hypothetical protein [Anaerosporobacter faecicola]
MSAFLGPIHYWLFNKIQIQEQFAKELAAQLGKETVLPQLREELTSLPEGNLEDIIETDNIHGWLQEKIHLVEKQLACVVESLLANGVKVEEVHAVAFAFGKNITKLAGTSTAKEAFTYLNDTLLDGMPCDHVNQIMQEEQNQVVWMRTVQLHEEFWSEKARTENQYDRLRDHLIQGILAPTNLKYENEANRRFTIFN